MSDPTEPTTTTPIMTAEIFRTFRALIKHLCATLELDFTVTMTGIQASPNMPRLLRRRVDSLRRVSVEDFMRWRDADSDLDLPAFEILLSGTHDQPIIFCAKKTPIKNFPRTATLNFRAELDAHADSYEDGPE
jgi:hypothetical protein